MSDADPKEFDAIDILPEFREDKKVKIVFSPNITRVMDVGRNEEKAIQAACRRFSCGDRGLVADVFKNASSISDVQAGTYKVEIFGVTTIIIVLYIKADNVVLVMLSDEFKDLCSSIGIDVEAVEREQEAKNKGNKKE